MNFDLPPKDWDDAYANGAHIQGGDEYPQRWLALANSFRASHKASLRKLKQPYGDGERQYHDVFLPDKPLSGTLIFVHGGYWMKTDPGYWSHLAKGCLAHGWQVVMPAYTLAPQARISQITAEVAQCLQAVAETTSGPLRLAGHSAGGHLISRMLCQDAPVSEAVQSRIDLAVSISGLHDLRPILKTSMNDTLGLSEAEANAESPALQRPVTAARICCWVGAEERPEFLRQSRLLANVWQGLGCQTAVHVEPSTHHFSVIEALQEPDSTLVQLLTSA